MHLAPRSLLTLALILVGCPGQPAEETGETAPPGDSDTPAAVSPSHVVLAWPKRGMSTLDPSYATMSLRPPGVTLMAQAVERGASPTVVPEGLSLGFAPVKDALVEGSTDFWDHAPALLGDDAPTQGVGLKGLGLEGAVLATGSLFEMALVPVVPSEGIGELGGSFALFSLSLRDVDDAELRSGLVVAPSSWDLGCGLCHGEQWTNDVLVQHDARHETTLVAEAPVRCGACHAQPDLGWPGDGEAEVLAGAMHSAHVERMVQLEGQLELSCLACHPGPDTPFYRGNHTERETSCVDCHGDMAALVAPERTPWQDLPRCSDCHATPASDYEQPGVSYSDSVGHGGLRCTSCHHSAHGLYASTVEADNAQNIGLQGYAGVISTCKVCHDPNPGGLFPHVVEP
jgi:hypothetical protein